MTILLPSNIKIQRSGLPVLEYGTEDLPAADLERYVDWEEPMPMGYPYLLRDRRQSKAG
jgi:hypothetical protein